MTKNTRLKRFLLAPMLAVACTGGIAAPAQAQIPGLLPSIEDVTPLDPLPIDGTWRIREIDQLIVIDRGHAYAVQGWTHALIFKILPGQVVLADLRENHDGSIEGRDLPLMAPVTIIPVDDFTLRVTAQGLVPVTYHLELVDPYGAIAPGGPDDGDAWFREDSSDGEGRDSSGNDRGDESWFPADEDG